MAREYNFDKLMADNPTKLGGFRNNAHQLVEFLEHPRLGEEACVIVAFPEERAAFCSSFMDTDDMTLGSDYEPLLIDGQLKLAYEL